MNLKLDSCVAEHIKETILNTIPQSGASVNSLYTLYYIVLKNVAKKIHDKLFDAAVDITFTLSSTEQMALYIFVKEHNYDDIYLVDFMAEVDQKLSNRVYFLI